MQVAKINKCAIEEQSLRLLNNFSMYEGSLATVQTYPNEILLCFGSAPFTNCENFNGIKSTLNPYTSNTHHRYGCMALNDNMPTVIGGGDWYAEGTYPLTAKVETFGLSGWTYEQDHPKGIRLTGCVSLGHGIVTMGGGSSTADSDYAILNDVYLFKHHTWSNGINDKAQRIDLIQE